MAIQIQPTTKAGNEAAARAAFLQAKADAAIAQINADHAALDGTVSGTQQKQIVQRDLIRQRQIIKYLAGMLGDT